MMDYRQYSHATITTLLSGIKTVYNKNSIKQHTNNCLKVIFIIVESPLCTVFLRGKFELSIVAPLDLIHLRLNNNNDNA